LIPTLVRNDLGLNVEEKSFQTFCYEEILRRLFPGILHGIPQALLSTKEPDLDW
jgi:hypothetical protein